MIINGGSRSNWRFFARHLVSVTENERADIVEIRGLAAETVLEALREMDALASGTRCKNFFYHANLNPRAGEDLSPEQWEQAVDRLESQLGLAGHSRVVVEHVKAGRQHRHVLWSRIDVDRMIAVPDSHNFAAHERTARELEGLFGQPGVQGAHGRDGPRPARRAKNWETFRGHGTGLAPEAITRTVTALWHQADSGQAFAASLELHGLRLCKGTRRDYCLLDAAGDVHSLARRLDGIKTAEMRARLGDLAPDAVPSIAEAQQQPAPLARPEIPDTRIETPAILLSDPAAPAEPAALFTAAEAPEEGSPLERLARRLAAGLQDEFAVPAMPVKAGQPGESTPGSLAATTMQRFAGKVSEVMRRNRGEVHIGFSRVERMIAAVDAVGHAAQWVRGKWQDLVEHLAPGARDRGRDGDIER